MNASNYNNHELPLGFDDLSEPMSCIVPIQASIEIRPEMLDSSIFCLFSQN